MLRVLVDLLLPSTARYAPALVNTRVGLGVRLDPRQYHLSLELGFDNITSEIIIPPKKELQRLFVTTVF